MAEPILYHRAPAFVEIYSRVLGAAAARSSRPSNDVLCFAATGTGAMESAVANLRRARASPRWSPPAASSASAGRSSATPSAPTPEHVEFEWGEKVDPGARSTRRSPRWPRTPRAVFVDPVGDLDRGAQRHPGARRRWPASHGAVLCVDAVSGLGAVDLPQDEWGVDVVVAGSQKSLMCPPGPRFASVSERALALAAEAPGGPLLLRLAPDGRAGSGRRRRTRPFTPAVTLFRALDVALELIFDEGLEQRLRAPRDPRPGGAGRGRRRSGWSASGPTTPTRTWSPRRASRTASTAPRCRS